MMIKIIYIIIAYFSLYASITLAEVAVIVNPTNTSYINLLDMQSIFLGKIKSFNNGETIILCDFSEEDKVERQIFLNQVMHKSSAKFNTYWARIIFSAEGTPPRKIKDSAEMLDVVAHNAGAIGYINTDKVTDSVRVILTLP